MTRFSSPPRLFCKPVRDLDGSIPHVKEALRWPEAGEDGTAASYGSCLIPSLGNEERHQKHASAKKGWKGGSVFHCPRSSPRLCFTVEATLVAEIKMCVC